MACLGHASIAAAVGAAERAFSAWKALAEEALVKGRTAIRAEVRGEGRDGGVGISDGGGNSCEAAARGLAECCEVNREKCGFREGSNDEPTSKDVIRRCMYTPADFRLSSCRRSYNLFFCMRCPSVWSLFLLRFHHAVSTSLSASNLYFTPPDVLLI